MRSRLSVYGVSTGFGGSGKLCSTKARTNTHLYVADTRTDAVTILGIALLEHQDAGVASTSASGRLPLGDPLTSTTMPESWVRAGMFVRINSLIRGHSGVRWELIESLTDFLRHDITPICPLRGTVSASGDLMPLVSCAGALSGSRSVQVYYGPRNAPRRTLPSLKAIEQAGLRPVTFAPKEHLGLMNGTAFSAALASLALVEVTQLAVLAQVCTAMGVEALLGTRGSYDPFIHDVARPHPGQVEVATIVARLLDGSQLASDAPKVEPTIDEDSGKLRQVYA
jgi:phenylalanine ammonia-lyase